jgi:hypothetical protein
MTRQFLTRQPPSTPLVGQDPFTEGSNQFRLGGQAPAGLAVVFAVALRADLRRKRLLAPIQSRD